MYARIVPKSFEPLHVALVTEPGQLPLGIVTHVEFRLGDGAVQIPFTSQQLNVREQVSAIYVFEEELPVNDSFTVLYGGQTSDDWEGKQPILDRERTRVALRARAQVRDTTARTADTTR